MCSCCNLQGAGFDAAAAPGLLEEGKKMIGDLRGRRLVLCICISNCGDDVQFQCVAAAVPFEDCQREQMGAGRRKFGERRNCCRCC